MGCLNSTGQFSHWFGNIHLSGPCNRKCYFCVGQHMMALDALNNLNVRPEQLKSIGDFITNCKEYGVSEINLTGSNTDPMLYQYLPELKEFLKSHIPELCLGYRTNGVLIVDRPELWTLADKASISLTSFDPTLYVKTMGNGAVPDFKRILSITNIPLKVNVVLCPETVETGDIFKTLDILAGFGIKKINLREPYGQPHIGNVLSKLNPNSEVFGMPQYEWKGSDVTYWDVHYVEVESVNLYANGEVSITYPVTKGCCPITGKVEPQTKFHNAGRHRKQWNYVNKISTSV